MTCFEVNIRIRSDASEGIKELVIEKKRDSAVLFLLVLFLLVYTEKGKFNSWY